MKRLSRAVLFAALLTPSWSWSAEPASRDNYSVAVSAYFGKDYSLAEKLLTQLIESGSDDPRVYYFRGLSHASRGQTEAASADYKQGAELEASGKSRSAIDKVLEKVQGSQRSVIEQVRRETKQALAKSTGGYRANKAALQELHQAISAYQAGRHQDAKDTFDGLAKELPNDPRLFYFRGLAQHALGDAEAAKSDFARGVRLEAASSNRVNVDQALVKVQGPARDALEAQRRETIVAIKLEKRAREKEILAEMMAARNKVQSEPPPPKPAPMAVAVAEPVAPKKTKAPEPTAVTKTTTKPAGSPTPPPPPAAMMSGINFAYLPADTEALIHVRVKELWNAPLLAPLKLLPPVGENLQKMKDEVGFTVADVESVTFATSEAQSTVAETAANGGAPTMPPPHVIVVRTSVNIDVAKIEANPEFEKVEEDGKNYYKAKEGDFAVYLAEPRTYVGGTLDYVKAAMTMEATAEPNPNFAFVDSSKQIVIAGSPKDLEGLKALIPDELGSGIPALDALAKAVKESDPKGGALGIGVSKKITIEIRGAFGTEEQAQTINKHLTDLVDFGKQSFELAKPSLPPPLASLAGKVVATLKSGTSKDSATVSIEVPEAAIQEATLAAPAMLQLLPAGLPFPGAPAPQPGM